MREIKFRAWDEVNRKMHYGDGGFEFNEDGCIMQNNIFVSRDVDDGAPIMQYTGLKDKNGVRIFEGDIVVDKQENRIANTELIDDDAGDIYSQIVFSDGSFMLLEPGHAPEIHLAESASEIEVIGNVFENAELLGVRDECEGLKCDSVGVATIGEEMVLLDCSISERELEGIAENLIKYHSKIKDEQPDPYVGDILKLKEYLNKFKRWKKENNIE